MARFHAADGTTAMVATTVSDSPEALQAAVEGVAMVTHGEAVPDAEAPLDGETGRDRENGADGESVSTERGAVVLGCNLEGPWIARSRAGARPVPRRLAASLVAELDDLVDRGKGTVRSRYARARARRRGRK